MEPLPSYDVLEYWGIPEVGDWLEKNRMNHLVPVFADNYINGRKIATLMYNPSFTNGELKLSAVDSRLLKSLIKHVNEEYRQLQEAGDFGSDSDEIYIMGEDDPPATSDHRRPPPAPPQPDLPESSDEDAAPELPPARPPKRWVAPPPCTAQEDDDEESAYASPDESVGRPECVPPRRPAQPQSVEPDEEDYLPPHPKVNIDDDEEEDDDDDDLSIYSEAMDGMEEYEVPAKPKKNSSASNTGRPINNTGRPPAPTPGLPAKPSKAPPVQSNNSNIELPAPPTSSAAKQSSGAGRVMGSIKCVIKNVKRITKSGSTSSFTSQPSATPPRELLPPPPDRVNDNVHIDDENEYSDGEHDSERLRSMPIDSPPALPVGGVKQQFNYRPTKADLPFAPPGGAGLPPPLPPCTRRPDVRKESADSSDSGFGKGRSPADSPHSSGNGEINFRPPRSGTDQSLPPIPVPVIPRKPGISQQKPRPAAQSTGNKPKPPANAKPIVAKPIVAKPIGAKPTVAIPIVAKPAIAKPPVTKPTNAKPGLPLNHALQDSGEELPLRPGADSFKRSYPTTPVSLPLPDPPSTSQPNSVTNRVLPQIPAPEAKTNSTKPPRAWPPVSSSPSTQKKPVTSSFGSRPQAAPQNSPAATSMKPAVKPPAKPPVAADVSLPSWSSPVSSPRNDSTDGACRSENNIEQHEWFFGTCSRPEADRLLKPLGNGAFLVRTSRKQGGGAGADTTPYALSARYNSTTFHLLIRKRKEDTKYALGSRKSEEPTFISVEELITHHQAHTIHLIGPTGGYTRLTGHPEKPPQ